MRIVHFAKYYPPEYGGIESVTEALAEDHSDAGNDVEVVCFTKATSDVDRRGRLVIRRVRAQTEKMSQPIAVGYLAACAQAALEADIIHVHLPNILAALAVLRLPRSKRVVLHWHADVEGKGLMGRLIRPLERAMLRRADLIVTTTENYAAASSALRPYSERLETIPIGIADKGTPSSTTIEMPPHVLFVGRLVPYKGLTCLLKAAADVRSDVEFRIIGVGPQETELKGLVRSLGISHKVRFLGRVGSAELEEHLESAALFCLPSINRLEAFGVVLLEAMRASRAVIATDIDGSGVPWVNSTGVTFPVGDHEALAREIDRLLANPAEIARLGREGRTRFEREFLRRDMSKRFLKSYSRILRVGSNPSVN